MKLLETGSELDGFVVGECLHYGSMAHIYHVTYAQGAREPGFPMVMKVPRMTAGDGAENIVSFEVEHQILQALTGPHVPRFVAAGDLERMPYLVMEYITGRTLEHWLEQPERATVDTVVKLGVAMAHAVHSLHQQNTVHLDLKPANVLVRDDGRVVLLDFGLSCNAHFPDLLAEQLRRAVGSPAWMAPEQVVGVRGDPRSDIFAIGVMLYQLLTGQRPFAEESAEGEGLVERRGLVLVLPQEGFERGLVLRRHLHAGGHEGAGGFLQRLAHHALLRALAGVEVAGRVVELQALGRVLLHQQVLARGPVVAPDHRGHGDARLPALIRIHCADRNRVTGCTVLAC